MNKALELITTMVIEAKSNYNDGWVIKGYKDDLKEIKDDLKEDLKEIKDDFKEDLKEIKDDLKEEIKEDLKDDLDDIPIEFKYGCNCLMIYLRKLYKRKTK